MSTEQKLGDHLREVVEYCEQLGYELGLTGLEAKQALSITPCTATDISELSKELKNLGKCTSTRTFKECEYWLNQYKLFSEKLIAALERYQVQS
jgi:hypothetical protein